MFTLDTTGWAVLFIRQSPLLLEVVGARQVQLQVQLQEEVGFSEGSGGVVRTVVPSRIDKLPSTWRQVHTEDVICSSSGCLLRSWLMHWSPSRMLLLLYASLEYRWRSRFPYNYLNSCLCHKQFLGVLVLEWNSQKLVSLVSRVNINKAPVPPKYKCFFFKTKLHLSSCFLVLRCFLNWTSEWREP